MWLFTAIGFFSVVQKPGQIDELTVRARVARDLDLLRSQYMPELSPTQAGAGTDYPYRAVISHEAFARGMGALARDIHYDNFKREVQRQSGIDRAHLYSVVWSTMVKLQRAERSWPDRST